MPRDRIIWPVYGFTHDRRKETVAHFLDWGDAASFAMRPQDFGHDKRNLYIGRELRREPLLVREAPKPPYTRIEERELPSGRSRWAA